MEHNYLQTEKRLLLLLVIGLLMLTCGFLMQHNKQGSIGQPSDYEQLWVETSGTVG